MASNYYENHFLISMPALLGSYFEDTITYLCHHSSKGALGIVVNRPLPLKLKEVLEGIELPTIVDPGVSVLAGGPVMESHPCVLHTDDVSSSGTLSLTDGLALTMATEHGGIYEVLEAISRGSGPQKYLVALGYAGWDSGQLEDELERQAWITAPVAHHILFEEPFETRIDRAARAIGFDYRKISPDVGEA